MTEDATGTPDLRWYADDLRQRGVRRIHVLAWRDLADPDAGGSEVHADEFMQRWADAGLEILQRTSSGVGLEPIDRRSGYGIVRRGSRYSVFPRTVAAEITRRMGRFDAVVEVWNGVPWFSPIWCRRPHITMLHHVHGPMWDQLLPGPLAAAGRALETRFAPPFYRRTLTVTPSDATREQLLELGFRPDRVVAVPNGVDPFFTAAGSKTEQPSIVAVGRLAPVKRFELVVDAAIAARRRVPGLTLSIIGDGPMGEPLQRQIDAAGATDWITLHGRLERTALVDHYRRSWLVVSGSLAEGWGLSLSEAAACGTAAVATDIRGHRSSVAHGVTGVLVAEPELGTAIADALLDHDRRGRLARAAHDRAIALTWDATALGLIRGLHGEVVASQTGRG